MARSVRCFLGASVTSFFLVSAASASTPYYIDQDSIRTFGSGCSDQDSLFVDVNEGAINIIFGELQTTSLENPSSSHCSIMFDVYAEDNYRIAAPEVTMGVDYSIDAGGKGIASAKMTTLGESRKAEVKNLYGTGSQVFTSPVAQSPKFTSCGGKATFRIAGRLTAIAPRQGGSATLTMDDANSSQAYSIKCPIIPKPCP